MKLSRTTQRIGYALAGCGLLFWLLVSAAWADDEWQKTDDDYWGGSYAWGYNFPGWSHYLRDFTADRESGDAPLTVSFSYNGFVNGSALEWEARIDGRDYWERASDWSSYFTSGYDYYSGYGTPGFMHTFLDPGTYRVSVTIYGLRPGKEEEYWDNSYYTEYPFSHSGLDVLDTAYVTINVRPSKNGNSRGNRWNGSTPRPGPSVYDFDWPEIELAVEITGEGPWDLVYKADCSIPLDYLTGFSWDLNNDGRFDRSSGRASSLERHLTLPGWYTISVEVTDIRGYSSTATTTFALGVE